MATEAAASAIQGLNPEAVSRPEGSPLEAQHADFWNQFQAFPYRWLNALFTHPRYLYLLIATNYGAFLVARSRALWGNSLGRVTLQEWIGDLLVGWAEVHLLVLALLLAVWGYVRWLGKIPAAFEWLRTPTPRLNLSDADRERSYLAFLREYQARLQSKRHPALIGFAVPLIMMATIVLFGFAEDFSGSLQHSPGVAALTVFALLWAFLGGLAAWPVYVTVAFLREIPRRFEILIQPNHPDRCGGLQPLGEFCLSMALPFVLSGFVMSVVGVGGIILSVTRLGMDLYRYFLNCAVCGFHPGPAYVVLALLLSFVTPLILMAFFMPLWRIHRYMEFSKRRAEDEFANRLARLKKKLRALIDAEGAIEDARAARDRIEFVQTLDPSRTTYPLWPFRRTIAFKLFLPQILSTAGFILGAYEAYTLLSDISTKLVKLLSSP